MQKHVHTAEPSSLANHAGIRMTVGQLTGLPIVDSEQVLVGMLSEVDLIRALSEGEDLNVKTVEAFMTKKVISIGADAPINKVMEIMQRERIIRVPVVEDGKLVGVVSRSNVLQAALTGALKEPLQMPKPTFASKPSA